MSPIRIIIFLLCFAGSILLANSGLVPVSLIKLTVNPEKYDNKRVIISGFLNYGAKNERYLALYLNKDALLAHSPDYVVINDFNEVILNKHCSSNCYASFIGTFKYSDHNSPQSFIGFLSNVEKTIVNSKP